MTAIGDAEKIILFVKKQMKEKRDSSDPLTVGGLTINERTRTSVCQTLSFIFLKHKICYFSIGDAAGNYLALCF